MADKEIPAEIVDAEYTAPPPKNADANVAVRPPQNEERSLLPTENAQGTAIVAQALGQLRLQVEMARAYPRDMNSVLVSLHSACQRPEFALKATYSYSVGGSTVTGPSVYLAEEMARQFGNMTWGSTVIEELPGTRTLRCYSWDLQRNIRKECDVVFAKKVQRKVGKGDSARTIWIDADERQLLMLNNLQASKGCRNMILALMPDDLKRDAVSWAAQTIRKGIEEDPARYRKTIMLEFGKMGVQPADLESLVGKKPEQMQAKDIEYLRSCWLTLRDGEKTWDEIRNERAAAAGKQPPPPDQSAAGLEQAVKGGAAKPKGGAT